MHHCTTNDVERCAETQHLGLQRSLIESAIEPAVESAVESAVARCLSAYEKKNTQNVPDLTFSAFSKVR